jgi:hypothetical protein
MIEALGANHIGRPRDERNDHAEELTMRLDVTQSGDVVKATMGSDGKVIASFVSDPKNAFDPAQPFADWVQDSGGTRPLEPPKPPETPPHERIRKH